MPNQSIGKTFAGLGGRGDDLRGRDLGEPESVERRPEPLRRRRGDLDDGTPRGMAERGRGMVEQRRELCVQVRSSQLDGRRHVDARDDGDLGVDELDPGRCLVAAHDRAAHLDHRLRRQRGDPLPELGVDQHDLGDPSTVPQQDEPDLGELPLVVQPPLQPHPLADECADLVGQASFHVRLHPVVIPDVWARGTRGATTLRRRTDRRPRSVRPLGGRHSPSPRPTAA